MPNILIVDDSVSVRKALERILQKESMDVVSADSAEQALEVLSKAVPDVIIADVVMPGMDGFELCQVLKADERYVHLPVILISGIVNAIVRDQAEQVGAVDALKKPFNPTDLIPTVRSALSTVNSLTTNSGTIDPAKAPGTPSVTVSEQGSSPVESDLRPFIEKSDIDSVLLISAAGDCLLNLGQPVEDSSTVASYFKFFSSAADIMGDKLGVSPLNSMLLEFGGACLLMQQIDEEHAIVLSLRTMAVQSVARFLLKKQLPHLQRSLIQEIEVV